MAVQREVHDGGRTEFERRWVPYPSIGGQWGRGPLSSAGSCAECHPRGGRGALTATEERPGASLRLGLGERGLPDPRYGRQLDTQGILGRVPAEGRLRITWDEHRVTLNDGEVVTLRRPRAEINALAYGPLSRATALSLRVAPALGGLGWLEDVPEDEIMRLRERQRAHGLTGLIQRVPSPISAALGVGRFGWKASQPTLALQAARAFMDDIGVTSPWHAEDNCTAVQSACRTTETVPHPEVKAAQLDTLAAYLRALSPPSPPVPDARGEALFAQLGCDGCHVPRLRTLRTQRPVIQPYTDLMLHAVGEDLADGLHEYGARGDQWRTAPLWGLRQSIADADGLRLLHDGRARDAQEAILWHGGEATPMRAAFIGLPAKERAILLRFLQSL